MTFIAWVLYEVAVISLFLMLCPNAPSTTIQAIRRWMTHWPVANAPRLAPP